MRNNIRFVLALSGLLLLTACKEHLREAPVREQITVKVLRVKSEQGLRNTGYVGTVEPVKSTTVTCRYPGTLKHVAVRQGDFVERGDLIAEVESSAVENTFKMAEATLKQAEDGYKRVMQVYASGSIPEVKKVEVETQVEKARASYASAKRSMEDCRIRAPFSGVVGDIFADEGVELSFLDPIARIMDISEIEIRFPVPEKEIANVKVGDKAFFSVSAVYDTLFAASIKTKGVSASALSHSYACTLKPLAQVEGLLPGMVCKVFLSGEFRNGIVIPSSVVQMDNAGKYVWLVKDNVVEKRYVEVDGFYGKGVIVTAGLYEDELVIGEGARKVCSGMTVNVTE